MKRGCEPCPCYKVDSTSISGFACDCGVCETRYEKETDISKFSVIQLLLEQFNIENLDAQLATAKLMKNLLDKYLKQFKSPVYSQKVSAMVTVTAAVMSLLDGTADDEYRLALLTDLLCQIAKAPITDNENAYLNSFANMFFEDKANGKSTLSTEQYALLPTYYCDMVPVTILPDPNA